MVGWLGGCLLACLLARPSATLSLEQFVPSRKPQRDRKKAKQNKLHYRMRRKHALSRSNGGPFHTAQFPIAGLY